MFLHEYTPQPFYWYLVWRTPHCIRPPPTGEDCTAGRSILSSWPKAMRDTTVSAFWYWGGGDHNAAEQISDDGSVQVRQARCHPFPLLTPLPSPFLNTFLCVYQLDAAHLPLCHLHVCVHLFLTFILETLY